MHLRAPNVRHEIRKHVFSLAGDEKFVFPDLVGLVLVFLFVNREDELLPSSAGLGNESTPGNSKGSPFRPRVFTSDDLYLFFGLCPNDLCHDPLSDLCRAVDENAVDVFVFGGLAETFEKAVVAVEGFDAFAFLIYVDRVEADDVLERVYLFEVSFAGLEVEVTDDDVGFREESHTEDGFSGAGRSDEGYGGSEVRVERGERLHLVLTVWVYFIHNFVVPTFFFYVNFLLFFYNVE